MYWQWIARDMQNRCLGYFEKYMLLLFIFTVVLFFKEAICIGSPEDIQFLTMISGIVFTVTGTSFVPPNCIVLGGSV